MKLQYINKYIIALSQTAKPKGWFHGERDIHPAYPYIPVSPKALRLATEAQRLVEVAKTQRQKAEAKVGFWTDETGRVEDMPMDDAMYVKMRGNITGSWMFFSGFDMYL